MSQISSDVCLVIPTVRTLDFLSSWEQYLNNITLIIVEDHFNKELPTPTGNFSQVYHYTWEDIRHDLGENEWIISRRSAAIRSYGYWKAYKIGMKYIITIDDDCYPVDKDFIQQHIKNLEMNIPSRWVNTYPSREYIYTRGIPYSIRTQQPVMISHGLWTNKIDLDAQTQLSIEKEIDLPAYPSLIQMIPKQAYYPMCGMNLGFRKEATPLMYFLLMGEDHKGNKWPYNRFDDIWAGIFSKKICDHLGWGVTNGSPFVEHVKASNPHVNLIKEKSGIETNEFLWKLVDNVQLTEKNAIDCYKELVEKVKFPQEDYFDRLKQAMLLWVNLFK